MKKTILFLLVVLLPLAACKKDKNEVDKLGLTVKNLATLINKSPNYIKQASPGEFDETESDADFLLFTYDEDADLGSSGIGYQIEDDLCSFLSLMSFGSFDVMHYMIGLTDDELGTTDAYEVDYYDGADLYEETFSSADDLWDYVEANDIVEEDIDFIGAFYVYNDVLVGAIGLPVSGTFMPSISFMPISDLKSTNSMRDKINEFKQHMKLK